MTNNSLFYMHLDRYSNGPSVTVLPLPSPKLCLALFQIYRMIISHFECGKVFLRDQRLHSVTLKQNCFINITEFSRYVHQVKTHVCFAVLPLPTSLICIVYERKMTVIKFFMEMKGLSYDHIIKVLD